MSEKTVFAVVKQGDHSLQVLVFEDRAAAEDFAATTQEVVGPHIGVWMVQTSLVPKEER